MENVDGIILILSCEKHKLTRLKEFCLKHNNYDKWKVIYIIGNLFLDEKYKLIDNIMYIKCEDSYLYLFKKLVLSLKYLKECFNIKEGILRCGDDLIFNENNLINFLRSDKYDFYGQSVTSRNNIINDIEFLKTITYDPFMLNYYKNNINELSDPKHGINLTIEELKKFLFRPKIWGPAGVIYFISLKCCNILIDTMEKINYDIFHFDEFSKSYPYLIEDVATTYVMYYNKIDFYDTQKLFDKPNSIAIHTNKYK
jgi:hypothetical protein